MKIKYYSYYDYFPNYKPEGNEPCIHIYNDNFVYQNVEPNSIALLIEPRSIQPRVYEYMETNHEKFRYVFTHDSMLSAKLPPEKVRWVTNMSVYGWSNEPKTKFCSMISSEKEMCEMHKQRKELAFRLENKIDCFGTYNGGKKVDTISSHGPYMYAVVIENYIDDLWFTEKILNCFSNKTIPIYLGARKIGNIFNKKGIIQVNSIEEIEMFINICLNTGYGEYYYNQPYVQEAINENYQLTKKFEYFESWFVKEYKELLDDLYSQAQRVRQSSS